MGPLSLPHPPLLRTVHPRPMFSAASARTASRKAACAHGQVDSKDNVLFVQRSITSLKGRAPATLSHVEGWRTAREVRQEQALRTASLTVGSRKATPAKKADQRLPGRGLGWEDTGEGQTSASSEPRRRVRSLTIS